MPSKLVVLLLFFGSLHPLFSREIILPSVVLGKERKISIHLPENFDPAKAYPTIFVLDGDRIGQMVSGINDYLLTCDRTMPAIVVGIHQDSLRWKDCGYHFETSQLTEDGQLFQEFLKSELIPFVDSSYKTTAFRVLVGHSYTATYLYLTWLRGEIPFNAYLALSPYLPADLQLKVADKLKNEACSADFFTATSSGDLSGHKETILSFQKCLLQAKLNDQIRFQNLEGKSHLTLVPVGIEEGLNHVFRDYQSLSNKYLFHKKVPVVDKNTLETYYRQMREKYGIPVVVRKDDVEFASFTLSHHRLWGQVQELSEWAIASFPEDYFGYYGMGAYYESQKAYDRALDYFQKGYDKLGADVLNKSDFYQDIERLTKKLGK